MAGYAHIRGVVFDLDDTLFPEIEFVRGGFRAVASRFEAVLGPAEVSFARMWELFGGVNRARVFDAMLEERGVRGARDVVKKMVAEYRGHLPSIGLFADAEALLQRLEGRMHMGLISDGPLEMQQNKVEALGLSERLGAIELTDLYGREFWKPHVRAFEEISRRLACRHEELLYVADNAEKDFVAPNRLGWSTVQIVRADGVYRERVAAEGGMAGGIIQSLDALQFE